MPHAQGAMRASTTLRAQTRAHAPARTGVVVRAQAGRAEQCKAAWGLGARCAALAAAATLAAAPTFAADFAQADYGMAARGTSAGGGQGIVDGRLLPCPSGTNPNCVSTSSTNDNYAAPWVAASVFTTSQEAAVEIARVFQQQVPEYSIQETKPLENGEYYLRYQTPGPFGPDIVEFLVRAEGVNGRNWEGDEGGGLLVTYRSIGNVKYLYPLQTPISDRGAQRKRMDGVRAALSWRLVGCELIECYQ